MRKLYKNKISKSSTWYEKYFFENPIKAIATLMLSFGGVLVLVFFGHINFMPDVDLASSTAVLAAVALLGLLLFIFVGLTAIAPGVATAYFRREVKLELDGYAILVLIIPALVVIAVTVFPTNRASLWFGALPPVSMISLILLFSFLLSVAAICVSARKKENKNIAIRFHIVALASCPALFTSLPLLLEYDVCWINGWIIGASYIFFPAIILWWKLPGETNQFIKDSTYGTAIALWGVSSIWLLGILCIFSLFVVFSQNSTQDDASLWTYAAIWLVATTFINIGIAVSRDRMMRQGIAIFAPTLTVLLLILANNFSALSVVAIKMLDLGEIENVRVSLSSQACESFNLSSVGAAVKCVQLSSNEPGSVCPVKIESRIGSQMRLVWDAAPGQSSTELVSPMIRKITFNKPDVLAWTQMVEKKDKKADFKSPNAEKPEEKQQRLKTEREKQLKYFCAAASAISVKYE